MERRRATGAAGGCSPRAQVVRPGQRGNQQFDRTLYPFQETCGKDLVFLGRIHPDKGVHLAIETAQLAGRRLVIAGIIQDQAYFEQHIRPHIDDKNVRYIGSVGVEGKNKLFAQAYALLHLNTLPERFGLVLAEANAAGVDPRAFQTALAGCAEVLIAEGIKNIRPPRTVGELSKWNDIYRKASGLDGGHSGRVPFIRPMRSVRRSPGLAVEMPPNRKPPSGDRGRLTGYVI